MRMLQSERCKYSVLRRSAEPHSTAEAVESPALPLESVDHVHSGDSLPLGVLGVGDGIPDDILQKYLEHSPGLLVDQSRDSLDSSPAGQPPDGGLGDALDVVPPC